MRQSILARCAILSLVAAAALHGQGAAAHHSFAAIYDDKSLITVKGTVARVNWANPHANFLLDVHNADGTVTQWVFELHSPNDMMRNGWPRDTVKPGDVLTVEGARERGGSNRAFAFQAKFPDGRTVFKDKEG